MSNQRTSRVLLEYRIAKQSADEAVNRTRRLANEIDQMRTELEGVEKAGKDADKGIKSAFNRRTLSDAQRLTSEIEAQNDALRNARKSVRQYNDEFDQVSRNVGLAGDVQSNLGAVGALSGIAGGAGVDKGVTAVGEVFALLEEAPRLASALRGLPATISSSVQALGGAGIGLIGAMGALTAVFVLATQAGQRAREATQERLTAEREINDLLITGTREEIEARREQLETQRQGAQQFRDEARSAIEAYDRDARQLAGVTGELGVQFLRLGETLGVGEFARIDELRNQSRDAQREVENLNRQIEAFDEALANAEPAAQDLIQAERELTQERLTQAQSVASQLRQEIQLRQQSAQQLQERQDAILNEIAITQTEISALRDSGDESEEVAGRINALTQQLMDLGRESTFIRDVALQEAEAREEAVQVVEKQTRALQAEAQQRADTAQAVQRFNDDIKRIDQQYFEERANLEQRFADTQIKIAEDAVKASQDALRKLQDERAELTRELGRDEAEAQIEAQRDERDALRDHLRNLQDIRQRAQDEEFEAILNRDFASLFRSRRQTSQQLAGAGQDFAEQAQDRAQAFSDERQDRLRQYQLSLQDAQEAYSAERVQIQQNRQQALQEAQQAQRRELAEAKRGYADQLNARKLAVQQELQLIAQTEAQKQLIFNRTQQALLSQAQQLLGNIAMQSAGRGGFLSNIRNNTLNANMTINGGNTQQVEQAVTNTIARIFAR